MEKQKNRLKSWQLTLVGSSIVLLAIIITAGVSWVLYEHTVNLLTDNLRQRLLSIAITQSANINPEDVKALRVESDWRKPEWARVVKNLKKAKDGNPNIVFMYIFRKKEDDSSKMEFVADAESINPYANSDDNPANNIDANGDGKIEPDGADYLQWPGQDYETPPEEAFQAYNGAITSKELYEDSYGQVLTGYAPIKDEQGNVIAVLGTDIKVNDFLIVTRQTLYPFLSFILFLISAIVILSGLLIRIWNKRLEVFAELDRQKDEVLHIVAHQLNTPINAVKWVVELLRSGDYSKEESAKIIEEEAAKLGDLSSMILDAARIQLGKKLPINPVRLDLNIFFKSIVNTTSMLAQQRKINLNLSIPTLLPTVLLDERYTRMTVENLLTNAIKYTPEKGNVDLRVEIKRETLYCEIRDTGIGIPKKDQGKIFGQLYRASNAAASTIKGNGLGLYAAKGAIEAQGGKIWFKSEEGRGTTFFIELPLKYSKE
jgi:signal transduction histidine kinase